MKSAIQIEDFKTAFKYYKSKDPPPDLNTVIDFDNDRHLDNITEVEKDITETTDEEQKFLHCKNKSDWKIFKLKCNPGIKVVKNVFSRDNLSFWAERCTRVGDTAFLDNGKNGSISFCCLS